MGGIRVASEITLYEALDRVDLDYRVHWPAATNQHRLCQMFPFPCSRADLRVETTGAVIVPDMQPRGDWLPGADPERIAVQGLVQFAPAGRLGLALAPLDAFHAAVGGTAKWRSSAWATTRTGGRSARIRTVRPSSASATPCRRARPVTCREPWLGAGPCWTPAPVVLGRLPERWLERPFLAVDPARAIATCLKPADATGQGGVGCAPVGGWGFGFAGGRGCPSGGSLGARRSPGTGVVRVPWLGRTRSHQASRLRRFAAEPLSDSAQPGRGGAASGNPPLGVGPPTVLRDCLVPRHFHRAFRARIQGNPDTFEGGKPGRKTCLLAGVLWQQLPIGRGRGGSGLGFLLGFRGFRRLAHPLLSRRQRCIEGEWNDRSTV